MIDDLDRRIIGLIQGDLPLDPHPFALMAKGIGIEEDEFLERLRAMKERGVMRRFGATLRHQEAGFSANAMVAWKVPEKRVQEVGEILAGFREVTHCYERPGRKGWEYNLYTMIHGDDRGECCRIATRMAEKARIQEYTLLFSEREFKKTSMAYF